MAMAASKQLLKQRSEITDCRICFEAFKKAPKLLPCGHSFGEKCLRQFCEHNKHKPGDQVPCPLCRTKFEIPEGGVSNLPKNWSIFFRNLLLGMEKARAAKLIEYGTPCDLIIASLKL